MYTFGSSLAFDMLGRSGMGDPLDPYRQHLQQTYADPVMSEAQKKVEGFVTSVREKEKQHFGSAAGGVQQSPMGPYHMQQQQHAMQQPSLPSAPNPNDPFDGMRGFGIGPQGMPAVNDGFAERRAASLQQTPAGYAGGRNMGAVSASPSNSVNQQQAQLAMELGSPSVGLAQSSVFSSPMDSPNSPFSGLYGIGLGGNRGFREGGTVSAEPTAYDELSRRDIATDVYRAFRESGFSDAQAQALTAEINRENSMRPEFLFGEHLDPANRATNVGMLSWQGSRAPQALEFLRERGVADESGNITPGYDALRAQADFIRYEMENNPEYAKTKEIFLSNPDIDPAVAHRVLGDDYIRWRRTDPEYRDSGYGRIYEGYDLLTGQAADFSPMEGVRPPARPQARPEDQAEDKSYLDYLSDALPYLEAAQLTGAPQARFDPPGLRRPQRRSGDDALKRLGLASLIQ